MTSHCITWHDTTQAITSHQMTWPSHDLTPQQTSRHQNTSLQSTKHHHRGTAEGSFTAKKWFGHRAGRSPCAHRQILSVLYSSFPFGNFRPRLVRALLVKYMSWNWFDQISLNETTGPLGLPRGPRCVWLISDSGEELLRFFKRMEPQSRMFQVYGSFRK